MVFDLNMDPQNPDSQNSPKAPISRGKKFRLVLIGFALVGIIAMLVLVLIPSPGSQIAWMTPEQFSNATKVGPLTRLKYRVKDLTAPIWRRFIKNRPSIAIDTSVWTLNNLKSGELSPGITTTTNAGGQLAWVISQAELEAFQKRLKSMTNVVLDGRPRVMTGNKMQSRISVGQSIPTANGMKAVGFSADFIPKIIGSSVGTMVNMTSTEALTSSSTNLPTISTNFAVLCHVLIPSGGALVVDGGQPKRQDGKHFLLIVSPAIIDPTGKPVRR